MVQEKESWKITIDQTQRRNIAKKHEVNQIYCGGCTVAWSSNMKLNTANKRLKKVQRFVCLCMIGVMRSCPTAVMEDLLGIMPSHIVIEFMSEKTILRFGNKGEERAKTRSKRSTHPAEYRSNSWSAKRCY